MELVKISNTALKVSLSREDMEFFDIEFDSLDYASTETRHVIWSILDEAKRTLGFEAARENLYIQAFRSRCGGCELFVSRKDESAVQDTKCMFRFKHADALINACTCLFACNFSGKSSLFVGDDDMFYLTLCGKEKSFLSLEDIGSRLKYSEEYLAEHARLVCDNAVAQMAKLR
ncbi:MAG: adaptor protein MecA [Clostridia bacterium]|nr:adaptor protein MecA [Clostridia bacterium]